MHNGGKGSSTSCFTSYLYGLRRSTKKSSSKKPMIPNLPTSRNWEVNTTYFGFWGPREDQETNGAKSIKKFPEMQDRIFYICAVLGFRTNIERATCTVLYVLLFSQTLCRNVHHERVTWVMCYVISLSLLRTFRGLLFHCCIIARNLDDRYFFHQGLVCDVRLQTPKIPDLMFFFWHFWLFKLFL